MTPNEFNVWLCTEDIGISPILDIMDSSTYPWKVKNRGYHQDIKRCQSTWMDVLQIVLEVLDEP